MLVTLITGLVVLVYGVAGYPWVIRLTLNRFDARRGALSAFWQTGRCWDSWMSLFGVVAWWVVWPFAAVAVVRQRRRQSLRRDAAGGAG